MKLKLWSIKKIIKEANERKHDLSSALLQIRRNADLKSERESFSYMFEISDSESLNVIKSLSHHFLNSELSIAFN